MSYLVGAIGIALFVFLIVKVVKKKNPGGLGDKIDELEKPLEEKYDEVKETVEAKIDELKK